MQSADSRARLLQLTDKLLSRSTTARTTLVLYYLVHRGNACRLCVVTELLAQKNVSTASRMRLMIVRRGEASLAMRACPKQVAKYIHCADPTSQCTLT